MVTQVSSFPAQKVSELKTIPGEPGFPVVGHTFTVMRNPLRFMRQWYDKYGEISWTNAFGIRLVYMTGPDANQFVFQNRNDIFSNNQGWDFFIGKFFHRKKIGTVLFAGVKQLRSTFMKLS